jgi:Polyketide cyclase / dehydrase and lipid transport
MEAHERQVDASGHARSRRGGPLEALRAFGVMLGGSLVLVAVAAWSVAECVRAAGAGRRPGPVALVGAGALVGYLSVVRPWLLGWGATAEEQSSALPGDELVDRPGIQTTRAVTVEAPVEAVWPWLAQIGQDRGGFYSYEWLENLAGCRLRNADRIHPEWQQRRVGETVLLHPASGLKLVRFDPPRAYAFEGGWYFALEPEDGRTRLIARGRYRRGLVSVAYGLLLEIPHFVMERKMLLGIKERAERSHREAASL